jgi:hypothetical protein
MWTFCTPKRCCVSPMPYKNPGPGYKDARDALHAIGDIMFERLIDLCEDRMRLWKLARESTKSTV